jgi:chromate transporter
MGAFVLLLDATRSDRGEAYPLTSEAKVAMVPALEQPKSIASVTLAALFVGFLTVSLSAFGGGVVWVRRTVVERRHWASDAEFADILGLCQLMPGPNTANVAVCIGSKLRGPLGAIAALSGFTVIPWIIGFSLGALFLHYAHTRVLQNILGGIAATAAGLVIATGIKLLLPHRRRPVALVFAALAFVGLVFGRLPLVVVVLGLAPLSIAATWIEAARGR